MNWEDFVEDNFNQTETNRILQSVDWDAWIYKPGLPPVQLDFHTDSSRLANQIAEDYVQLNGTGSPKTWTNYTTFYSNLKVVFLENLTYNKGVNAHILAKIDNDLNITETKDPECKQRWFPIGIKNGYKPVMEKAHEFISSQGRLKYLNPIYRALVETGQKDLAIQWFKENEDFYHPLAVNSLSKLLGVNRAGEEIEFLQ